MTTTQRLYDILSGIRQVEEAELSDRRICELMSALNDAENVEDALKEYLGEEY